MNLIIEINKLLSENWSLVLLLGGILGFLLNPLIFHRTNNALEDVKTQNSENLAKLNHILAVTQEIHLEGHRDKLELYKKIIAPIAMFISKLEFTCGSGDNGDPYPLMHDYYPLRIEVLSHLAFFAPVDVCEKVEDLLNYMFLIIRRDEAYSLEKITELGEKALNIIRKDIGIAAGEIHLARLD